MGKFIDFIIRFVEKLPFSLQGTVMLILSTGWVAYKIMNNDKIRKMIFNSLAKRMSRISKMGLYTAPVFYRKEFYMRKVQNLLFAGDPHKTRVFQIILKEKLESDIECLEKLLKENKYEDLSKEELIGFLNGHVNLIVKTFEQKALAALIAEYGEPKGTELFNFVMYNPGGYAAKRIPRVDRIFHEINEVIGGSRIFDNNYERIAAYMNEVQYAINMVVASTERMFREFNGEIRKIIEQK